MKRYSPTTRTTFFFFHFFAFYLVLVVYWSMNKCHYKHNNNQKRSSNECCIPEIIQHEYFLYNLKLQRSLNLIISNIEFNELSSSFNNSLISLVDLSIWMFPITSEHGPNHNHRKAWSIMNSIPVMCMVLFEPLFVFKITIVIVSPWTETNMIPIFKVSCIYNYTSTLWADQKI